MENENNGAPATNGGQDQELEINLDESTEVDVETLKAELAKEKAAKQQILARAKAAEAKLKEPPKNIQPTNPSIDIEKIINEEVDLRLDGYTKEEVAFLKANGGRKALDNPFVKTAIQTIRSQKQAEAAAPETDGAKSEVERKYTNDQLKKMSSEELSKILPHSNR